MSATRSKSINSVTARPSGLITGGRISEVSLILTAWTALPAIPLAKRNAVAFQNQTTQTFKINFVSTTGVIIGWFIGPGGELFEDITDSIIIFGRAVTGDGKLIVKELS